MSLNQRLGARLSEAGEKAGGCTIPFYPTSSCRLAEKTLQRPRNCAEHGKDARSKDSQCSEFGSLQEKSHSNRKRERYREVKNGFLGSILATLYPSIFISPVQLLVPAPVNFLPFLKLKPQAHLPKPDSQVTTADKLRTISEVFLSHRYELVHHLHGLSQCVNAVRRGFSTNPYIRYFCSKRDCYRTYRVTMTSMMAFLCTSKIVTSKSPHHSCGEAIVGFLWTSLGARRTSLG